MCWGWALPLRYIDSFALPFSALFHNLDAAAGELDGARVLQDSTVAAMTRNQLPGAELELNVPPGVAAAPRRHAHKTSGVDLASMAREQYAEVPLRGTGFGFGLAVNLDPVRGEGGKVGRGQRPPSRSGSLVVPKGAWQWGALSHASRDFCCPCLNSED